MSSVLTILLSHQSAAPLSRVLQMWQTATGEGRLLLAYGGTQEEFARIDYQSKIFIANRRLRTRDHQRQYQSYTSILRQGADWMKARPQFRYIHLVEFDHLPVADDLEKRMVAQLQSDNADLLAHHLHRVDGTGHPHYLYHASNPDFHQWIERFTLRRNDSVVLSMFGSGSFWRRECFDAVAAMEEPFPMYFEIYLPTLAHHLGFRVRTWEGQSAFVVNLPSPRINIERARAAGAWTIHPVKTLPESTT